MKLINSNKSKIQKPRLNILCAILGLVTIGVCTNSSQAQTANIFEKYEKLEKQFPYPYPISQEHSKIPDRSPLLNQVEGYFGSAKADYIGRPFFEDEAGLMPTTVASRTSLADQFLEAAVRDGDVYKTPQGYLVWTANLLGDFGESYIVTLGNSNKIIGMGLLHMRCGIQNSNAAYSSKLPRCAESQPILTIIYNKDVRPNIDVNTAISSLAIPSVQRYFNFNKKHKETLTSLKIEVRDLRQYTPPMR